MAIFLLIRLGDNLLFCKWETFMSAFCFNVWGFWFFIGDSNSYFVLFVYTLQFVSLFLEQNKAFSIVLIFIKLRENTKNLQKLKTLWSDFIYINHGYSINDLTEDIKVRKKSLQLELRKIKIKFSNKKKIIFIFDFLKNRWQIRNKQNYG